MRKNEKLNYVEFPSSDLEASKRFFTLAFGWSFEDFGPNYSAFADQGIDGGFYRIEPDISPAIDTHSLAAPLLVFYSHDLAATQARIESSAGRIVKPIFEFPGGRRFHFREPGGNELAVWSDQTP